jgi:two-component system sensor kinase FixL
MAPHEIHSHHFLQHLPDGCQHSPPMTEFPRKSHVTPHSELEYLLRLQDRLLHVSRLAAVGEMSNGIAHELNQPLCAVANYAQACHRLLEGPNPDIGEIRDSLTEIASQALRAGDVIQRLRSLTRPRDAQQEALEINAPLAELTDLICSDTRRHRARYQFEPGSQLPPVRANPAQIQQLALNLVRNAIEAMLEVSADSRTVTLRTALSQHGEVEVTVSDNGPGVAPTVVPHLFQPFSTTKPNGTGLGLAISRTIARAHSGTLTYQPNTPTGARFTLTLPPAPPATDP